MLFNTENIYTEVLTYINDHDVNNNINMIKLMTAQRVRDRKYVKNLNFSNYLIFIKFIVI